MTQHIDLDALQTLPSNTPITDELIRRIMAAHPGVSARAQADYYEAVHQELAPLCREFELEVARLKADMQSLWGNRRAGASADTERLDWLESNRSIGISHEWQGDDDYLWCLYRISGSPNDRDHKAAGEAQTLRDAIDAALAHKGAQ